MSRVVGLQISLAARMEMRAVDFVEIGDGKGIVGDRYENARHRHVTVQSLEEIALAEAEHGDAIDPFDTRRTSRSIAAYSIAPRAPERVSSTQPGALSN